MASILRHCPQGQAHSRLSGRDNRPPVSVKSANNDRVDSPSRDHDLNLHNIWNSNSGHVCHSPQCLSSPEFMSPIPDPQALAMHALSQDWQGRSMYMFLPFSLLSKVAQKLRTTQNSERILVAPWWLSQPWFPHLP